MTEDDGPFAYAAPADIIYLNQGAIDKLDDEGELIFRHTNGNRIIIKRTEKATPDEGDDPSPAPGLE